MNIKRHAAGRNLRRLGIRRTMIAGFAAIIAIFIGVGIYAGTVIRALTAQLQGLNEYGLSAPSHVARAQSAMWELRYGVSQFIAVPDTESRGKIVEAQSGLYKTIDQSMAKFAALKRTPEEMKLVEEFTGWYKKYAETRPKWL